MTVVLVSEDVNNCGTDNYGNGPSNKNTNGFYFKQGQWYTISQYVKVNDPFKNNGEHKLYINGQLVVEEGNLTHRSVYNKDTEINKFMFNTFHGGNTDLWSPSKTVYVRYDNFAVVSGLNVLKN